MAVMCCERWSAMSAASTASRGQPKGEPLRALRISAGLSGADGRDHLLANRMLFGGFGMARRLERMVGAISSTLDDSRPCGAVGLLEAREHADKSVVVCRLDAIIKRREQDFVAAALENLGIGDDFTD